MDESKKDCCLFEIHKIGTITDNQKSSLALEDIRRVYCEIVPIDSIEQFKGSTAIAQIPAENHFLVDKNVFKDLLNKQANDLAAKKSTELAERVENTIKSIKERTANQIQTMFEQMISTLKSENEALKSSLGKELNDLSKLSTQEQIEKSKKILDDAKVEYEKVLVKLLDQVQKVEESLVTF